MNRRLLVPMRWLALALLAAPVAPTGAAPGAREGDVPVTRTAHADLDDVLASARKALGIRRLERLSRPLLLSGRATLHGVEGTYSLVHGHDGRFIQEFRGPISAIQAHDGETTWMLQPTGATVEMELADREMILTSLWIQTGYWLSDDAPLEIRVDAAESDALTAVLRVAYSGGTYSGTLAIDRETGLPSSWSSVEMGRLILTRFERYRRHHGLSIPTRIVVSVDGRRQFQAVIDDIDSVRGSCEEVYSRRVDPDLQVAFRAGPPAELQTAERGRGHVFVQARINGSDPGWFLFDTGSVGTILSTKAAEELGLEMLGTTHGIGVGGETPLAIAKLDRLELGRLDLRNVPVGVLDLGRLVHQVRLEMKGIIGNNVIGQAMVEYDLSVPRIALHDPATYELKEGSWQPLQFSSGKPVARVHFEGHDGLFTMDTAASGNLLIHAPTVDRYQLLEDRETRHRFSFGVGGSIRLQAGHLDWVEFGGQRFEDLPALFATEDRGTAADRLRDGIVGFDLMRHFQIVFDYTNRRIALRRHEPIPAGK